MTIPFLHLYPPPLIPLLIPHLIPLLHSSRLLREVSHIVLDEVHERSIQSDFLTIILRDVLPSR